MPKEINEPGILAVTTNKNVVFRKKSIRNIFVDQEGNCVVTIIKTADEGELLETKQISGTMFLDEIEPIILEILGRGE